MKLKCVKAALLLLSVILFLSCSDKEFVIDYRLINNLKGDVKSVNSKLYNAELKSSGIEKGLQINSFLSEYVDNTLAQLHLIRGDFYIELTKQGKLKSLNHFTMQYTSKIDNVYDENNNLIKMLSGANLEHITTYTNDTDGNCVADTTRDINGDIINTSRYVTEDSRIKEIATYDADNMLSYTFDYVFNRNSLVQSFKDGDGKYLFKINCSYDGVIYEFFRGDREKFIINRDGDNVIEEIKIYDDNELIKRLVFVNDDGNMEELKIYGANERVINEYSFKYEFDDYGNWTKRVVYVEDVPKYINTREIEYFK
jgi:hypothetical protein